MDQNFNNGFDNQNSGNDGYNNPYSNPYDQSQQNYYNSYEQSTQQTQQNYAQQYQQTYGQPQQDYNQYNQNYNQQYQQPYNQPYGQQYGPMYQEDKSAKRFAIASLVLSIVSFLCCGIITSTLGIVFGSISLKKQPTNNGLAKAGLIVGIIGLIGSILGTIWMNCTGVYDSMFSEYMCHLFM